MTQLAGLRDLDARILVVTKRARQSDLATYTGTGSPIANCDVYVNRGVQLANADNSAVLNDQITIEAFRAQILEIPRHGATFVIGSETFTVDRVSNKDESRVVCIVKVGT